jgi:UDP-N-acetylmuramyl pentapeptide phosphotransferase/UDP-N-acetylglucosamine-1-phosphate transferase
MQAVNVLIFMLISFGLTRLMVPAFMGMFREAGFVRPNYRLEEIPLGMGLVFLPAAMLTLTLMQWWEKTAGGDVYLYLFALTAMGFFGLVDDVFGSRKASGLKGHFKKLLFERELTTGGLKALAGGFVGILAGLAVNGTGRLELVILDGLIIALSANALNLLDLRPGRAGKSFLLLAAVLSAAGYGAPQLVFMLVVTASVLAFLPYDLAARLMMGDTGSNMLGVTIGITAAWVFDLPGKLVFLSFLVLFHLYTEKYSLTRVIERNRVLNFFDMLGRK